MDSTLLTSASPRNLRTFGPRVWRMLMGSRLGWSSSGKSVGLICTPFHHRSNSGLLTTEKRVVECVLCLRIGKGLIRPV